MLLRVTKRLLLQYFIMWFFLLVFFQTVFSKTIIYGKVKRFNPGTGMIVVHKKYDNGISKFFIDKLTKVYYKSRKNIKNYEFLENNLFDGTRVKIVAERNKVKKIFVLEIPQ